MRLVLTVHVCRIAGLAELCSVLQHLLQSTTVFMLCYTSGELNMRLPAMLGHLILIWEL